MIAWLPHVSLHIHFSCCFLLILLMPSGGLISSPLLAPKGQLMKHYSNAVLPVLLLSTVVVLLASSCEGRGLPVHDKVRSSSKSHRLPGEDVAATSSKADVWLSRQMEARLMMAQQADAKVKEGTKTAAASVGAVRATPTPAVTVSQRLSRQEDTGFHLDYAGPRTHTPSHN